MRIALISMPWALHNRPSIQLGVLKGYIQEQAPTISASCLHPYLSLAGNIGMEAYRIIAEDIWAGEALYCALLFPDRREQARSVYQRSLGGRKLSRLPDFDRLVNKIDNHLDNWISSQDFTDTKLAGFSICFGQLPPSLLAANRLKNQYPKLKIAFGGSACVAEIGASLLDVFPAVDFVISGEGERSLLGLCRFLQGKTTRPGPSIMGRKGDQHGTQTQFSPSSANEIRDLDTLPVPDYEDYFLELRASGLNFIPQLPVEFSRGCWWNKCAFCNLNLQWCGYRWKKSERMRREILALADRFLVLDFAFADNALPPAETDTFFAGMAMEDKDIRFFAEIRTNNKEASYQRFRAGGLDSVQIGIEAFSDSLLKRMNKGTSVIQNLAAMKNCLEAGIRLDGNLILEFPGSTAKEVEETLHVLNYALPFRPLSGAAFFLGHGSPVWNEPGAHGITAIRHHPFNRRLYPPAILKRLDLLIRQGSGDRQHQKKLWQPVRRKLANWHAFHAGRNKSRPALEYRDGGNFIIIRQERPGRNTENHRLAGTSRQIYLACRQPVTIKSLLRSFNSVTEKALDVFLADLANKKILFRQGDTCLALAVHRNTRT